MVLLKILWELKILKIYICIILKKNNFLKNLNRRSTWQLVDNALIENTLEHVKSDRAL